MSETRRPDHVAKKPAVNPSPRIERQLSEGLRLRVEALAPWLFRVRIAAGEKLPESGLTRYGILRTEWPPCEAEVREEGEHLKLATSEASVRIAEDGRLMLLGPDGASLLDEARPPVVSPEAGHRIEFALKPETRLYGLGDETRDRIQKRGHMARIWVKNVACYAPSPVLLSTSGWGLFVNTTHRHYFDMGRSDADRLAIGGRRPAVDYYLFTGIDLPQLLDRYTDLAGKPALLPLWGYGLTFVCNQQADARQMLDDCLNLRRPSPFPRPTCPPEWP